MAEKIIWTIKNNNHTLSYGQNENTEPNYFLLLDDKYLIDDSGLDYFCNYYTQLKFTTLRRAYRDVADNVNQDPKKTFRNMIRKVANNLDDFIDFGAAQGRGEAKRFLKYVYYAARDVDNELSYNKSKPVNKQDGEKILEILVKMFDQENKLIELSKTYFRNSGESVRAHVIDNDKRLRKMFDIDKKDSLIDKIFQ